MSIKNKRLESILWFNNLTEEEKKKHMEKVLPYRKGTNVNTLTGSEIQKIFEKC